MAVRKLVTEKVGDEDYQYFPVGEYIVCAPDVCDGRPTFKYTGIEVAGILAMLADGDTIDEIIEDYSGRISREAIVEAIQIAGKEVRKLGRRPQRAA
ncbi:MAG: DUF433 domain-containing protein [Thermodesulfobacteriota bacterium]